MADAGKCLGREDLVADPRFATKKTVTRARSN